ncbi:MULTISPECIES: hypothetical protein [unclassified Cryobacterium]|uniref:hypothetical protein n=1 Tax=unclassified Cryobacterium TaxID=2649013 RepID=UPI000CE2E901|nr:MULTISPECIES: hypothetical protein [unclassified Cryobacterium]
MRKITKVSGAVATAALLLAVGLSPAMAATEPVNATIAGGALVASTPSPTMSSVLLDGTTTTSTGSTATDWSISDPRGTGAALSRTAAATAFTSAAGAVDSVNYAED